MILLKCKVCYFYSALFFLIFILPFSTAAQTNFSTLLYSPFRLLSNKWSQGSYMPDPFSVNYSIH